MQAYKVKGKIDLKGNLVITEPINLVPGEVEVILLQSSDTPVMFNIPDTVTMESFISDVEDIIPGLKQWLEEAPAVPFDFDPEQAKWEYLQEKHNL